MAGGNCDDGHGAARHVEELHTVANLSNARHFMALNHGTEVPGAQPFRRKVDGENRVFVEF